MIGLLGAKVVEWISCRLYSARQCGQSYKAQLKNSLTSVLEDVTHQLSEQVWVWDLSVHSTLENGGAGPCQAHHSLPHAACCHLRSPMVPSGHLRRRP